MSTVNVVLVNTSAEESYFDVTTERGPPSLDKSYLTPSTTIFPQSKLATLGICASKSGSNAVDNSGGSIGAGFLAGQDQKGRPERLDKRDQQAGEAGESRAQQCSVKGRNQLKRDKKQPLGDVEWAWSR